MDAKINQNLIKIVHCKSHAKSLARHLHTVRRSGAFHHRKFHAKSLAQYLQPPSLLFLSRHLHGTSSELRLIAL